MIIFKKRLVPLIAVICAFICFTVLGLTLMFKPEQTFAATSPTVTNVEDVSSIAAGFNGSSGTVFAGITEADLNTEKAAGTHKVYVSSKSATEDSANSKNTYAGNLTITAKTSAGAAATTGIVARLLTTAEPDNIIAFRTVYTAGKIRAIGRMGQNTTYADSTDIGGYGFEIGASSVDLIAYSGGGTYPLTTDVIIATFNYNNTTLSAGDELLVTYGAIGNDYYLKIERVAGNVATTILDKFTTPHTSTQTLANNYETNTNKNCMWVTNGYGANAGLGHTAAAESYPLVIGGVNHPIFDEEVYLGAEVGVAVSTLNAKLNGLKAGYTFVNGADVTVKGYKAFDIKSPDTEKYYESNYIRTAYVSGKPTSSNIESANLYAIMTQTGRAHSANFTSAQALNNLDQAATSGNTIYASSKSMTEDATYSQSQYSGNVTINTTSGTGVHAINVIKDYDAMTFRTKWLGSTITLGGKYPQTSANYATSTHNGGYLFELTANSVAVMRGGRTDSSISQTTIETISLSSALQANDELLITYGGVQSTTDTNLWAFYVKVQRFNSETRQLETLANRYDDGNAPVLFEGSVYGNAAKTMYVISPSTTQLVVGGVYKPLFDAAVEYSVDVDADKVGQKVSTVLAAGYTLENADADIRAGEMIYAGTYTTNYYEVANYKFDANIRVVPTGAEEIVPIKVEDMDLAPYLGMGNGNDDISSGNTIKFDQASTNGLYATIKPSSDSNSLSKYAGNVTISNKGSTADYHGVVFRNSETSSVNDVISFRTVYTGADIYLLQMLDTTYAYPGVKTLGGYMFTITADGFTLIKCTDDTVIASGSFDGALSANDEIIITFGNKVIDSVTPTGDTAGYFVYDYYLKVEKYGSADPLVDKIISSDVQIVWRAGDASKTMRLYAAVGKDSKLLIGGIDRPMFSADLDLGEQGQQNDTLESVALTGYPNYSWKDTSTELIVGKNSYDAILNYYGKNVDVNITVTATAAASKEITLIVDGQSANYLVYENKPFVLEELTTDGKMFIGWLDGDGKIYNSGYEIEYDAATDGMTFTLLQLTFSLDDGASIRYGKDETGNYGMRFVLNVDTEKAAEYIAAGYITDLSYAIAPTDTYFTTGKFVDGSTSVAKTLLLENAEISANKVAFSISSIQYQNFAREFGGVAFFTVNYVNGGEVVLMTAFDADKNSRSVYEVSMIELSAMYAYELTAEDSGVAILEGYLNQVADVTITENEGDLSVNLTTTYDRSEAEIPYSIVAAVTDNGDGDSYTVALEITFAAGNGLGDEGTFATQSNVGTTEEPAYGWIVPVIVRVGTEVYEMNPTDGAVVEYKSASPYENYKIVMTFVYTPVKVN